MAGLNGSPSTLAQCIPALARASQLLCTVSQPDQAREALQQAVGLLDNNGRFADIASVAELAERCRVTARTASDDQLAAACRQLGATVARQMAVLAQEMQLARIGVRPATPVAPAAAAAPTAPVAKETPKPVEPAKPAVAPKPALEAVRPVEAPKPVAQPKPAEPVKPVAPPKPVEAARPAEKPIPVEKPKPVEPARPAAPVRPAPAERPAPLEPARSVEKPAPAPAPKAPAKAKPADQGKPTAKPQVDPGWVQRISVAATDAEKAAVLSALQAGKRFAVVGKETIIDTKTNRMWAARCGPILPYRGARSHARILRLANYADWRLPTPEELSELMAEGGSGAVKALGMFSTEGGGKLEWLWSSQSRRRFWFFGQKAACLSVRTWQLSWQKAGTPGAGPLLVRSVG